MYVFKYNFTAKNLSNLVFITLVLFFVDNMTLKYHVFSLLNSQLSCPYLKCKTANLILKYWK